MLNEDYRDMLRALGDEKVRFLLVGAYALAVHGYARATMDMDIWVEPSARNAEAVLRALARFGAPIDTLTKEDLDKYLWRLEEAKKRDHRVIGKQLDLFSFHEEGPGFAFFHPKGMIIWNAITEFWRSGRHSGWLHPEHSGRPARTGTRCSEVQQQFDYRYRWQRHCTGGTVGHSLFEFGREPGGDRLRSGFEKVHHQSWGGFWRLCHVHSHRWRFCSLSIVQSCRH